MKKNETLAVIFIILATIITCFFIFGIEKYRRNKFYAIELIARAPNNGNWYPKKFTLPYGKEACILIRNIETVSHGFALPDFNISVNEIKAGEVKAVRFIPNKRGTFPFMCTVWCSNEHLEMSGEIIVK